MSLRLDYFIKPEIRLWQDPEQFCFNTDSFLLARFLRLRHDDTILEIGCNNGALLVWADLMKPARLDGVEIQKASSELARKNQAEFIQTPGTIYNCAVQDLEAGPYSVVFCNPPFFVSGSAKDLLETPRNIARFELKLNLEELVQHSFRLLKSSGRLFLVYRPDRLQEVMVTLKKHKLGARRLQIVYDRRDNEPKTLLIEAVKEFTGDIQILPPAWIQDVRND